MQGKSFQFTIDGTRTIVVNGGSCSSLIQVSSRSGTHTITETPAANTHVVDVQVTNGSPSSRNGNTETVTVNNDGTAAHETLVRFFNAGPGPGLLKVCKQSPDPTLQGQGFSFTENSGPAFTVTAGPVGAANCSGTTSYADGTIVNVHEIIPTNVVVSQIDVSQGGSKPDLANGNVSVTIAGGGTTIVTYTDKPAPIPQTGFIEICKVAADRFVSGWFDFTITSPGLTKHTSVATGQCSGPIVVNAGNVGVAETLRAPFVVSGFSTFPSGRLISENDSNGTAVVTVPVSSSANNETLVTVTNQSQQGLVKICKSLDANGGALANQTFTFNVTDAAGGEQVGIVVGSAPGTQCRFLSTGLPLGSTVTATEQIPANPNFVPTTSNPVSTTVESGINVLTVTNSATGFVEICKNAADASTATQSFNFTVTGALDPSAANQTVKAGQCSPPIRVFAGSQSVSEQVPGNFNLVRVVAVHADDNSNALRSGPNPATVDVRAGGTFTNETIVTFTDAVKTGTFKICKVSPEQTLQGQTFSFTSSYTVNGVTVTRTDQLQPGQCSGLSSAIPVVDANGNPITVNVTEAPFTGAQVSQIAVSGAGTQTAANTATGTSSFTIGIGLTVDTYTNVRTAPGA